MTAGNFQIARNLFDGTLGDSVCRMTHAAGTFGFGAPQACSSPFKAKVGKGSHGFEVTATRRR